MGAITQYTKLHHTNADILALKAGNDSLLGGNYKTGIPAIKRAVKNNKVSEEQIDQSVKRILKEKLRILKESVRKRRLIKIAFFDLTDI